MTTFHELLEGFEQELTEEGELLHGLVAEALPLPRSLTGDGVRSTLALLDRHLAEAAEVVVHEVPTGTRALDWTVPKEWNVREAYIVDPAGERIADFAEHRLHLLGYSVPVRATMSLAELDEHLYSLREHPQLIPYRTSYYTERWGFCLPHAQRRSLPEGDYQVVVDTSLEAGSLTYGEVLLPGRTEREVLLSCHVCHPQLANDNLSALAVMAGLIRRLARLERSERRFTYRFVFAPGTIGALVWLSRNEDVLDRVEHGLVAANLGDRGAFHYKRSRRGNAVIDRAVEIALRNLGETFEVEQFSPFGYDERQYCSPGFDLPVGSLTRTPWGRYPQYHTSADDLELVRPECLAGAVRAYLKVFSVLEHDRVFVNLSPKGEPQLGTRGLYSSIGGGDEGRDRELALLWVLNQCDGSRSLLSVAERSEVDFRHLADAAQALIDVGLLAERSEEDS